MSPTAPRDRGDTERRLIAAAQAVLLDEGAAALGVNALARRAGCDKQLVYRYFGGLDGVIAALGLALAERIIDRLDPHAPAPGADYGSFVAALLRGLIALYREEPVLARVRAAEWAGDAALAPLVTARGAALADWIARHRPAAPEGVDVPALNALLIGAVEAAVLSAQATGRHAGLPLQTQTDWARVDSALMALVGAAYAGRQGH